MKLKEMTKPAKICPQCGKTITGNHYWYKGAWKCKGAGKDPQPTTTAPQPASVTPQPKAAPQPASVTPQPKAAPQPASVTPQPTNIASPQQASEQTPEFQAKLLKWLSEFGIDSFEPTPDGINIEGDLDVIGSSLATIPTKFNEIDGGFMWIGGNIKSLKNNPNRVTASYVITRTNIMNLDDMTQNVGEDVKLEHNVLVDSLEGITRKIGGILTIKDMPKITHLHNIHEKIDSVKSIVVEGCPIQSHVLGLMLIDGLTQVSLSASGSEAVAKQLRSASDIISKHIDSAEKDIFACMDELIEAGLSKFAQL